MDWGTRVLKVNTEVLSLIVTIKTNSRFALLNFVNAFRYLIVRLFKPVEFNPKKLKFKVTYDNKTFDSKYFDPKNRPEKVN